jgi:hypothetical protein
MMMMVVMVVILLFALQKESEWNLLLFAAIYFTVLLLIYEFFGKLRKELYKFLKKLIKKRNQPKGFFIIYFVCKLLRHFYPHTQ